MDAKDKVIIKKVVKVMRAVRASIKEEKEEVEQLKITEEDKEQAERIVLLLSGLLASRGIVLPTVAAQGLNLIAQYIIRDIKDGLKTPDNLILKRVINNIKK